MTAALIAVGAWFGWPVLAGLVLLAASMVREWWLDRDAARRINEITLIESCWNLPSREPRP